MALAAALVLAVALLIPAAATAQSDSITPTRDADRPFTLEKRLEFEVKNERNYDLDSSDREDVVEAEPLLRLGATYQPSERWLGFVEVEFLRNFERESGEPTEARTLLRLNQIYFGFNEIVKDVELRVGRWLYRDEREWMFDENIDGVHALYDDDGIEIDAFAGRVNHWQRDLLDSDTKGDPVNTLAVLARYELAKDVTIGAYAVQRNDVSRRTGRLNFVGLRSHGEPTEAVRYWAELAHVRGNDGERSVRGHAFDFGVAYSFNAMPWRPRLLLGYARGSGDSDPDEGTDRSFRQTGLQSNEARLGGLAKFKFYGEALDPELSNIAIVSTGVGVRPHKRLSIDLLLHRYRQPVISEQLRIEVEPGDDTLAGRRIGSEIDVVAGYRPTDDFIVEVVLGQFRPDSRFRNDEHKADKALFGRVEMKLRF